MSWDKFQGHRTNGQKWYEYGKERRGTLVIFKEIKDI